MGFMKKGLRADTRKQKKVIMTDFKNKLNKIPYLSELAYVLSDKSKDVTVNNINDYLKALNALDKVDEFDKHLIISEYNRLIASTNE